MTTAIICTAILAAMLLVLGINVTRMRAVTGKAARVGIGSARGKRGLLGVTRGARELTRSAARAREGSAGEGRVVLVTDGTGDRARAGERRRAREGCGTREG